MTEKIRECQLYSLRLGEPLRNVTMDDVLSVSNGSKQKPKLKKITEKDLSRYNEFGGCVIGNALIGLCACRYFDGETFLTDREIRQYKLERIDVTERCPIPKLARKLPVIG